MNGRTYTLKTFLGGAPPSNDQYIDPMLCKVQPTVGTLPGRNAS